MSRRKLIILKDFHKRLRLLMVNLGYRNRQDKKFAEDIEGTAGFLSQVLNDESGPSVDLIAGIAKRFPEANIRWLLTGEGAPLDDPHDIVIEAHPRVIPLGEKIALPTTDDLDEYLAVPLVEGKIAAGPGRIVREEIHSFVWVYRPELGKRRNLVAVRIGDQEKSMLPTLAPGSILILDRNDKEISRQGIYAVRTGNDECAVKRIHVLDGHILLCSDNPEYPPLLAPTTESEQLIIGRAIWTWKSLLQ